jgi:hypothetical protein
MRTIDRLTRWPDALRTMGNSIAARATIVVPILGYFLLLSDQAVEFLKANLSLCEGRSCSAPLRLQLFYLGGTVYGLAAAIYAVACPSVIQRFADASEYFLAQREYFTNRPNLLFLTREILRLGGQVGDRKNFLSQDVADLMAEHYVVLSYRFLPVRVIALALFAIGIVLVAVPSIWTFWEVARTVLVRQLA